LTNLPNPPIGHKFLGWFDSETNVAFEPKAPVTKDLKHFAKWEKEATLSEEMRLMITRYYPFVPLMILIVILSIFFCFYSWRNRHYSIGKGR